MSHLGVANQLASQDVQIASDVGATHLGANLTLYQVAAPATSAHNASCKGAGIRVAGWAVRASWTLQPSSAMSAVSLTKQGPRYE